MQDQRQVTLGQRLHTTKSVGDERKAVRELELAHDYDIALEVRKLGGVNLDHFGGAKHDYDIALEVRKLV